MSVMIDEAEAGDEQAEPVEGVHRPDVVRFHCHSPLPAMQRAGAASQ